MKKNRNVGVIGVGQSVYSSHREEVNQPEMIHEAVVEALEHAGITMDDGKRNPEGYNRRDNRCDTGVCGR